MKEKKFTPFDWYKNLHLSDAVRMTKDEILIYIIIRGMMDRDDSEVDIDNWFFVKTLKAFGKDINTQNVTRHLNNLQAKGVLRIEGKNNDRIIGLNKVKKLSKMITISEKVIKNDNNSSKKLSKMITITDAQNNIKQNNILQKNTPLPPTKRGNVSNAEKLVAYFEQNRPSGKPFKANRSQQVKAAQKLLDSYDKEEVKAVIAIILAAENKGRTGKLEYIPRASDLITLARGTMFQRTLSNGKSVMMTPSSKVREIR